MASKFRLSGDIVDLVPGKDGVFATPDNGFDIPDMPRMAPGARMLNRQASGIGKTAAKLALGSVAITAAFASIIALNMGRGPNATGLGFMGNLKVAIDAGLGTEFSQPAIEKPAPRVEVWASSETPPAPARAAVSKPGVNR